MVKERLAYWRRILGAYVLNRGVSNLAFWHTPLAVNSMTDRDRAEIRRHPMNFSARSRYELHHDSDGVIMLDYRGSMGLQYNPNAIAQAALGHYEFLLDARDKGDAKAAEESERACLTQAKWFLGHGRKAEDDILLWEYDFAFKFREVMKAPYRSALAQGQALSVLIRAFLLTGDQEYADRAHQGFNAFRYECIRHPAGVISRDDKGVWLEECCVLEHPDHVLNGFVWSLWGVNEYALWSEDSYAKKLFKDAEATLADNLDIYDLGFWTCYDDAGPSGGPVMPVSWYYQRLHIAQMEGMHQLTGREIYRETADRWRRYFDNLLYKSLALIWKCWFKLRHW